MRNLRENSSDQGNNREERLSITSTDEVRVKNKRNYAAKPILYDDEEPLPQPRPGSENQYVAGRLPWDYEVTSFFYLPNQEVDLQVLDKWLLAAVKIEGSRSWKVVKNCPLFSHYFSRITPSALCSRLEYLRGHAGEADDHWHEADKLSNLILRQIQVRPKFLIRQK